MWIQGQVVWSQVRGREILVRSMGLDGDLERESILYVCVNELQFVVSIIVSKSVLWDTYRCNLSLLNNSCLQEEEQFPCMTVGLSKLFEALHHAELR